MQSSIHVRSQPLVEQLGLPELCVTQQQLARMTPSNSPIASLRAPIARPSMPMHLQATSTNTLIDRRCYHDTAVPFNQHPSQHKTHLSGRVMGLKRRPLSSSPSNARNCIT